jgi:hypothetical protein
MSIPSNFQRAHWAAVALEAFREQVGRDDEATSAQDLICDLGHYCRLRDLDFLRIAARGISMWCAESDDPDGFRLDPGPDVSIAVAGGTPRRRKAGAR